MKRQIWQFACVAGVLMATPFIYMLLLAPLIWLFPAEAPAVLGGFLTCLGLLLFFVSMFFITVPVLILLSALRFFGS